MKNDLELLNAVRARDQQALAKIFDLYAPSLYKFAFRLGHDAIMADHIVGDVFAKLLEQLSADKGPITNLRSYLYRATYHMILDKGRYSRRTAPLEVADSVHYDARSTSPSLEEQAMMDLVSKIIRNDLTEDQRHVVILRFIEDFSLKETAMILGKNVNHVKVIQNRAIAKLRKSLGGSGIEGVA